MDPRWLPQVGHSGAARDKQTSYFLPTGIRSPSGAADFRVHRLIGQPFFIKQTRIVGGAGNWDYLTVDLAARLLFIAHGLVVQVIDLDTCASLPLVTT